MPLVRVYEILTAENKIFVFMKDLKTFHIIIRNTLSVFIEVANINTINIYSNLGF
jgi:hypothetical protein